MDLINEFIQKGDSTVLENLERNIYELNRNDKKYWDFIITNSVIKENMIIENINNIDLELLFKYQKLSSNFINLEVIWNKVLENNLVSLIVINQKLSNELIDKITLLDGFSDWDNLCRYQNLTIDFINSNKDKLNWNLISENQFLTLEFIAENRNLIIWSELGKNYKIQFLLNDAFVEIFNDKEIWSSLIWSKNISEDVIIKNLDKLSEEQICDMLEIRKLSEQNLLKIIETYNSEDIYSSILEGQELSLDFIQENLDKFGIDEIIDNQNINYDFLVTNKDNVSLKKLSYNDNLNEELILKIYENIDIFNDEFDWEYISEYVDFSKNTVDIIKELSKEKLIKKEIQLE